MALGESAGPVLQTANAFCVLASMAVVQIRTAYGHVVFVLMVITQLKVGLQSGRHNTREIGRRKFCTGNLTTEHVGKMSSLSRKRNVLRCTKITFLPLLCKVPSDRRCFEPPRSASRSPALGRFLPAPSASCHITIIS